MSTPLPPSPARNDPPAIFVPKADAFVAALVPFQTEMNALQVDVTAKQVTASTAADTATDNAAIAVSAAINAAHAANVTLWISGKTYSVAEQVFSPINFNVYVRKVAGAGTTDPSMDISNWKNATLGLTLFNTLTASTILSNGSTGYYTSLMTSQGQNVTLPNAVSLSVVSPCIVIDNSKGGFAVGVRNSSGKLLTAIGAGGIVSLSLKDNSTVDGVWGIDGTKLEPGMILASKTFPSTQSTDLPQFVSFDENVSVHFMVTVNNQLAAVVVNSLTNVISAPFIVTPALAGMTLSNAFKVSSTTAALFYGSGTTSNNYSTFVAVITLGGTASNPSISVGTPVTAGTTLSNVWGKDNGLNAEKIVQLAPTLFVATFNSSANVVSFAISITGNVVTLGSIAQVGFNMSSDNDGVCVVGLTSTTALIIAQVTGGSTGTKAVVATVTGTTITFGTVAAIAYTVSKQSDFAYAKVSPTKVFVLLAGTNNEVYLSAVNVSGNTAQFVSPVTISSAIASGNFQSVPYVSYVGVNSNFTRYSPVLTPLSDNSVSLVLSGGFNQGNSSVFLQASQINGTVTITSTSYLSSNATTQILPLINSSYLAMANTTTSSTKILAPISIGTGTTVLGNRESLDTLIPSPAPYADSFAFLPSGEYLIQTATGVEVYKCAGNSIIYKGRISLSHYPVGLVKNVVSSNRVVLCNSSLDSSSYAGSSSRIITSLEMVV